MPIINFAGNLYPLHENETVLDGLLRHGLKVNHSCKAGSCGSCLLRATSGNLPQKSQSGLKDSWKARGYFLACTCRPEENLSIEPVGSELRVGATIAALKLLSADVLQVWLQCDAAIDFRAGQYISIVREQGLARSYSIASLPDDGHIELHVRKIAGGRMSGWLHSQACEGDRLSVLGPSGECFYVPGQEDQPLVLAGTGTGLAPLYGIIRDALKHQHRGPIHLFHGALHKGGLYLVEELRRLSREYSHFRYESVVMHGEETDESTVGAIDQVISSRFHKLAGCRGFICGDPAIVQMLRKKFFLLGMASREIFADAFVATATT